jgi:hypothetical protein
MLIIRRIVVAFALGGLILSPCAHGQSTTSSGGGKPPAKAPAEPNLLAGPGVEDEASDGNDNMQGPGGGQRRRAVEGLPLRPWLQQVRGLDDITAEQQQKIASIMQEMERAQQDYRSAHSEEMRQLQEEIRQMREGGREPDPAVREQMQRLESQMPNPTDYQRRIWDTLTSQQQEMLRARVAELEQQRRRDGGRRGQASDGKPGGNAPKREGGDEMMSGEGAGGGKGDDDQMKQQPSAAGAPDRPNVRDALQRRRRAAAAGADERSAGLDEMAQRRVAFLRQHVSAPAQGRAGDAPSKDEREFKFDEDR